MNRRKFIIASFVAAATARTAMAGTVQESIVAQLRDQGFRSIRVSKTLLGRVRIQATSDKYSREIILNPRTGEILRDYWTTLDGAAATGGVKIAEPDDAPEDIGAGGGGDDPEDDEETGPDHEEDDEDDDDEREDDEENDDEKDDDEKDDDEKDD